MLKQAEEAGTLTFEMQRERAQDYRNAGEFDKAIDAYEKALDMTTQSYQRGEHLQRATETIRPSGR